MRHSVPILGFVAVFAGCARTARSPQAALATADSIVLERTSCFGACPAYRLSLNRAGRVAFLSRNPGDNTHAVEEAAAPGAVDALARRAAAIGFDALPDTLARDTALCLLRATDQPTAVVTVYRPASTKRVEDYHGCPSSPVIAALRELEAAIDSATGSARWVRPAGRR